MDYSKIITIPCTELNKLPETEIDLIIDTVIDHYYDTGGMKTFGKAPEVYHMRLSKMLGQGNKDTVSHKTEPIFIWKKTRSVYANL
jgi:hypothetical protein